MGRPAGWRRRRRRRRRTEKGQRWLLKTALDAARCHSLVLCESKGEMAVNYSHFHPFLFALKQGENSCRDLHLALPADTLESTLKQEGG